MTGKRFFLKRRFLRKDTFHDVVCHKFMDSKETEKTLNQLYDKYSSLKIENEQLKKAAKEFAQNRTQHNLWRLRTVLKDSDVE